MSHCNGLNGYVPNRFVKWNTNSQVDEISKIGPFGDDCVMWVSSLDGISASIKGNIPFQYIYIYFIINESISLYKNLYMNMHINFTYNDTKVEITPMSTHG
jgi:hypothetical protein